MMFYAASPYQVSASSCKVNIFQKIASGSLSGLWVKRRRALPANYPVCRCRAIANLA